MFQNDVIRILEMQKTFQEQEIHGSYITAFSYSGLRTLGTGDVQFCSYGIHNKVFVHVGRPLKVSV